MEKWHGSPALAGFFHSLARWKQQSKTLAWWTRLRWHMCKTKSNRFGRWRNRTFMTTFRPFHWRNVTICTKSVCFGKDRIVQRTTNVRPFRQQCHFGEDYWRRTTWNRTKMWSWKNIKSLTRLKRSQNLDVHGYYMPHHAVVREAASTTKLRVVFNASASQKGDFSLNDVIEPGPSLLPNLPGLLMRLREYRCAVQADIRKAFFMISVKEEDRRFLRFVWFTTEGKIEIWRLKKLPFWVNCSPFILNAVIRHHLRQEEDACTSESVRQIIRTLLE